MSSSSSQSRPVDSGRKDSLGRTIRVADGQVESRADAPPPDGGGFDFGMADEDANRVVAAAADRILAGVEHPTGRDVLVEQIQNRAYLVGEAGGVYCDEIMDSLGVSSLEKRVDADVAAGRLIVAGETEDGEQLLVTAADGFVEVVPDGFDDADARNFCRVCRIVGHRTSSCVDAPAVEPSVFIEAALPARRTVRHYRLMGSLNDGYESHRVWAQTDTLPVDAGLTVHTAHVKAHRLARGHKYSVSAPGHHWDGIAQPLFGSDRKADVDDMVQHTVAASGVTRFGDDEVWMSTVIDTEAGTGVIRARVGGGDRLGSAGHELRVERDPSGFWTVTGSESGVIRNRMGAGFSLSDEPAGEVPVEDMLGWFRSEHERLAGG